jgi:hypothetical protein
MWNRSKAINRKKFILSKGREIIDLFPLEAKKGTSLVQKGTS